MCSKAFGVGWIWATLCNETCRYVKRNQFRSSNRQLWFHDKWDICDTLLRLSTVWVWASDCVGLCMCFSAYSHTPAAHIYLAMTFIESHLVCFNIRRTVGSLWGSRVILWRVTHLEPSHRADKPLLCLGHLEGRSCSLLCALHESQSPSIDRKIHLTWSWTFHTLTYRSYWGADTGEDLL